VLIPLVSTLTSIGLDECPTDVVLPDGGQIFPAHVVLKTRPYQFLTTGLFWTTTDIYEDETSSRKAWLLEGLPASSFLEEMGVY